MTLKRIQPKTKIKTLQETKTLNRQSITNLDKQGITKIDKYFISIAKNKKISDFQSSKKSKKVLEIDSLLKKKSSKPGNLPIMFSELKRVAKSNGYTHISGNTWIFAEHPNIAKKLGVYVSPKSQAKYDAVKKRYNIVKIKGILTDKDIRANKVASKINPNTPGEIYKKDAPDSMIFECVIKTKKGLVTRNILLPFENVLLKFKLKL